MEKGTPEEVFAKFLKMLESFNDDNTSESNERHVQGGTRLSLFEASAEKKSHQNQERMKRARKERKGIANSAIRLEYAYIQPSGQARYRMTVNKEIAKAIAKNHLKYVSVQKELLTNAVTILFTKEDTTRGGFACISNGVYAVVNSKFAVGRIMEALNVSKKVRTCDLQTEWELEDGGEALRAVIKGTLRC